MEHSINEQTVRIPVGPITLEGDLVIPESAHGVVLFAHGSGSSRHSPRNRYVAQVLQQARLATLLMDLLTRDEEVIDEQTAALRFNIEFLAARLIEATGWLREQPEIVQLPVGYFGASTGAAAALVAAASLPGRVRAVVSRGGRPDLAGEALRHVTAPTLLIVGSRDVTVLELNRRALALLPGENELKIVPGATHLFEEPGALEVVAQMAKDWFESHLSVRVDRSRAA